MSAAGRGWGRRWGRPAIALPLAEYPAVGLVVLVAALAVAPAILSSYQLTLFSTGVAYSVSVAGVALGFAGVGMLALTQPAMMLIGGYVTLHLMGQWHVPFLLAAAIAAATGMVVAIPLGWLTARLDRFAFAVLGFAFTYLVSMLASSGMLVSVTGGELGKPFPAASIFGVPLRGDARYVVVAIIAVAAFAASALLFRSTAGRILVLMKQDDVVARTMGANTDAHRIGLTAVVSGYGALGGALVDLSAGFIAPPQFGVGVSISLLAMALVGGTRYLLGAFIGALILQVMPALLGLSQNDQDLLTGAILLLCLTAIPDGVVSLSAAVRPAHKGRRGAPPIPEGRS